MSLFSFFFFSLAMAIKILNFQVHDNQFWSSHRNFFLHEKQIFGFLLPLHNTIRNRYSKIFFLSFMYFTYQYVYAAFFFHSKSGVSSDGTCQRIGTPR